MHGFYNRSGEGYDATITLEDDGKVTLAGGGESTGLMHLMKKCAHVQLVTMEQFELVKQCMRAIMMIASSAEFPKKCVSDQ